MIFRNVKKCYDVKRNIRNHAGNKYREKSKLLYFFIKECVVKKKMEWRGHLTKKLSRIYKEINISHIQHTYIYFKKKIIKYLNYHSNQIESIRHFHLFSIQRFTPTLQKSFRIIYHLKIFLFPIISTHVSSFSSEIIK